MKKQPVTKIVAIVGGGPRGLSALESLCNHLAVRLIGQDVHVLLFEECNLEGAGRVYDINQPDTNWLNISKRGLTLPMRKKITFGTEFIPEFPSYHDWAGYNSENQKDDLSDIFPLRSELGRYLSERFQSIATLLKKQGVLTIIKARVLETDWNDINFRIPVEQGITYYADELVLTIGHQPTKHDEQIRNWCYHSKDNSSIHLKEDAYPAEETLEVDLLSNKSIVALRGFGLAMIDLMRILTIGKGGVFHIVDKSIQKLKYQKSGNEPFKIIPFSLDGLPMAPKPINLNIDKWFLPTKDEKDYFFKNVERISKNGTGKDVRFIIDAITPIISRVYIAMKANSYSHELSNKALEPLIKSWLLDRDFDHKLILPKTDNAFTILKSYIDMATGSEPVSLDFCIGQVWRHCQPTFYRAVSFSNLEDQVVAEIIELDERLKRYSYGPPVESLQQLVALIEADIVTLDFVKNPDIQVVDGGWKFSKKETNITSNLMINSVLDTPKLLEISSPIVSKLLHESLVQPKHTDLGVETHENACVSLSEDNGIIPLAILGRLSKGTLIGVDAILECFGQRSELWAKGVVERLF